MPSPLPTQPSRSRFVRLAHWCNTHRWRTFFAWVAALVVLQGLGGAVGGLKETENFRLPGTESQTAYDLLAKHFPAAKGDTDQVVFHARTGRVDDAANRSRVEAALKRVQGEKIVASVESPFAEGGRITQDGRIAVAMVNYDEGINDLEVDDLVKVEDAAFTARSSQLQVEHGGMGAQMVRFENQEAGSEGIGIVAAAIVLLLTFGSAVAAGLPLLATLLAIGSTMAVISLLSQVVDTPDFAPQLAMLIGLGVGIDYALFVVTRYRAEVRGGMPRAEAVEKAVDTAGRTVMFAAITVVIALLGLMLLGLNFMNGVALGAGAAVLATMFAALTLLPALIGGSGPFVDGVFRELDARGGFRFFGMSRRIPIPGRNFRASRQLRRERKIHDGAAWERWSHAVQARPWVAAGLALVILLGLALPTLNLRLGSSDAGVDPTSATTRKAYDLIAEGFGAGTNGSFVLVAQLAEKGDKAAAEKIAAAVEQDRDFSFVAPPNVSPDGRVATIVAYPKTGPQDEKTMDTLENLRDDVLPAVERQTGADVKVGGLTASTEDFASVVSGKLPLFVGVVVLLSALLLLVVFRSVVIPIKAAAMNLLSIGAALGFITLIFQEGVGAGLLGIETGPIESFVPVLMFAIVFGLSMDYEVFLISRVHEEWEHTRHASGSVARGLQTTGRVITAAALIMIVVFGSFALGDERMMKLFGIGFASAIFFDAVIIRCLLVPAIMEILGAHAWHLPAWLDRRLPRVSVEGPAEAQHGATVADPVPEAV